MKGWYWTQTQRKLLEKELAHTYDAPLFRRILALLQVDLGKPISEVARFLCVNRRSVYRWMERYTLTHQVVSLERQPGQGRPLEWNEDLAGLLESAMRQPPVELGYPANGWTAPLLEAFLTVHSPSQTVSTRTVRRRLRDLGYVWKHGRYILPPDPEEEKKTPDSTPNTGFASHERDSSRG
jgi:transposase